MPFDNISFAAPFPAVAMQRTLREKIACRGVGLHSGLDVTMVLHPAPIDQGIVFIRSDIANRDNKIPARWDHVTDTMLCTVIGNKDGATVATIEHIMAALQGIGIDNITIELDGAEVPIMDGSAEPFVFLIECAGVISQNAPKRILEILKPVTVTHKDMIASLKPSRGSSYEVEIDFNSPVVRRQKFSVTLSDPVNDRVFERDLARARTFGFLAEVEKLRQMGLAKGGSLENAIVIDSQRILNEGGLRYQDEFARHKVLDAIGDLALAGATIKGQFHGVKTGHALNNQLLHALFADKANYRFTKAEQPQIMLMAA